MFGVVLECFVLARRSNQSSTKTDRLKRFGVDPHWYEQKLAEQHGVCAICEKPETAKRNGKVMRLSVDHDHKTGKPRGLLCAACNRAIGLMKEDPQRLEAAAGYLRQHASKSNSLAVVGCNMSDGS
jgi:Recombination endonuclease VII